MKSLILTKARLNCFSLLTALFLCIATCPIHSAFGQTLTNQFVAINPATGVLTPLNTSVGDASVFFLPGAAVNPNAHQYYVVRIRGGVHHLLSIDTRTGALVESPPLSTGFINLGFDAASNTLLGLTQLAPLPPPVPTSVPTMNEWGMIIFTVLAGAGSVYLLKKRSKA